MKKGLSIAPRSYNRGHFPQKIFSVFVLLLSFQLITGNVLAQTIAAYSPAGLTGYGPSPFTATTAATNTTIGGLMRGAGVSTSGSAAGNAWGGSAWTATSEADAITANSYATFTIQANAGYSVSLSSFSLFYRRSGTGPGTGQLQYSTDGTTFTDVTGGSLTYSSSSSSGAALGSISLSGITDLQNVPSASTITLRIVNWGGGSAGTWYVFSSGLSVSGTVNVATGCSGTPAAGTASVTTTSVCGSGATILSLSGATAGTGVTYQWASSATGAAGSFSNISGATDLTYTTPTVSSTTYYEAITTCTTSSSSDTSSITNLTVNPLPAAITGVNMVCAGSTTLFSDDSTGGTWISANTAIATVATDGTITGIAPGTTTITYTLGTGCMTTSAVNVSSLLTPVGVMPGTVALCAAALPVMLTDTAATFAGGTTASSGTINMAANAAGTAYPNAINISGIPDGAIINNVAVNFNFTSSFLHDYVINLQAPNGHIINLAGAHSGASYSNATINSSATTAIPTGTSATVYSGVFSADEGSAVGAGGYVSDVTNFVSLYNTPNGSWSIIPINTTTFGDASTLASWTITISYTYPGSATWSPMTGLFTDAATTIAYTGTATDTVYAAPAGTTVYTVISTGGACSSTTVDTVTINPLPDAGTITGTATVCPTAVTTLSDLSAGGTWSSTAADIATVDASGNVTGIAAGTTTISYTVTNSCGTAADSVVVTVNPLPDAGTITGTASVCPTASTSLTDLATGGIWSSTATGIATVDAAGNVTGITAGTTTISYTVTNSCGTAADSIVVTVNPLPDAGTISGTAVVCPAAVTALTDLATGGTWSVTDATIATVDASGNVTGIATGTTTISYSVTNICATAIDSVTLTVSPLPNAGAITGTAIVCPTAVTSLTDLATGGTWSSTVATIATVDASGNVTGVAAGTTTISYSVTNSCGTAADSVVLTVSPLPNAGSITGTAVVCPTAATTLADLVTGGTWSTADGGIATIDASGVVTGITTGTTTVAYSVTNSCGTAIDSVTLTVSPLPNSGTITGTAIVCPMVSTSLTDLATGGIWSSTATGIATVDASGNVTGVAAGTTNIFYTVTNSCGTIATTVVFTVSPLPNAGAITGTTVVCPTFSTSLADVVTGGTWSSTATGVATVSATGSVTGIAAGTTSISYSVTNSCGTAVTSVVYTVSPLPDAGTVSGLAAICAATSTTLEDGITGGTWSSSTPGVATIDAAGTLNGLSAGITTISYSVTNSCGTAIATSDVTIYPLPFAYTVSGGGDYCAGGTGLDVSLSGSETGISYQLFQGVSLLGASVPGTGAPIDFGLFTDSDTYTVFATNTSSTCTSNMTGSAIINAIPVVIPSINLSSTAINDTSCTGTSVTFTAIASGTGSAPVYTWSVNGMAMSATGAIYSYAPANGDTVSVTLVNGDACAMPASVSDTNILTVLTPEMPSVTAAASATTLCPESAVTFTATPVNGGTAPMITWIENGVSVATGSTYSFTPTNGDVVYCLLQSSYACALADTVYSDTTVMNVVTTSMPSVTITASPGMYVPAGEHDTLTANVTSGGIAPAYQWKVNGVVIPGATSSVYVTDTFSTPDTVTCVVTNTDLCSYTTFQSVLLYVAVTGVNNVANNATIINIVPNPNNGSFSITGSWADNTNEFVNAEVMNMFGQVVYKEQLANANGKINARLQLGSNLPAGAYMLELHTANERKTIQFVIAQ